MYVFKSSSSPNRHYYLFLSPRITHIISILSYLILSIYSSPISSGIYLSKMLHFFPKTHIWFFHYYHLLSPIYRFIFPYTQQSRWITFWYIFFLSFLVKPMASFVCIYQLWSTKSNFLLQLHPPSFLSFIDMQYNYAIVIICWDNRFSTAIWSLIKTFT